MPRRALEDVVEVATRHRPALPVQRIANGRTVCDDERGAIDLSGVDVDDVVADRVIERGADDLGAARHLGIRRRIDLDLIELPVGVGHAEAGLHAGALAAGHHPAVSRHAPRDRARVTDVGDDIVVAADAIGEPARVGHFVDAC